jgi:DNA-binding HxlR family transcriptional regulator
MPAPPPRSWCPIACTLDLIGDRWTLLIVRDLFLGRQRFDEFRRSPEGIATNILTDRLRRLEELGLVARTPSENHRSRGTYQLTARGQSLRPVMRAFVAWGLENIPGTKAEPPPEPAPVTRPRRRR